MGPPEWHQAPSLPGRLALSSLFGTGVPATSAKVLQFTLPLGVVINQGKSGLIPSQKTNYLGMELDTLQEKVFPSLSRREKLRLTQEFMTTSRT